MNLHFLYEIHNNVGQWFLQSVCRIAVPDGAGQMAVPVPTRPCQTSSIWLVFDRVLPDIEQNGENDSGTFQASYQFSYPVIIHIMLTGRLVTGLLAVNTTLLAYAGIIVAAGVVVGLVLYFIATNPQQRSAVRTKGKLYGWHFLL